MMKYFKWVDEHIPRPEGVMKNFINRNLGYSFVLSGVEYIGEFGLEPFDGGFAGIQRNFFF